MFSKTEDIRRVLEFLGLLVISKCHLSEFWYCIFSSISGLLYVQDLVAQFCCHYNSATFNPESWFSSSYNYCCSLQSLQRKTQFYRMVIERFSVRAWVHMCMCACVLHYFSRDLCSSMDCSPPGFSVHRILQARILEWVATLSSKVSSRLWDRLVSLASPALGRQIFLPLVPPGKHICVYEDVRF